MAVSECCRRGIDDFISRNGLSPHCFICKECVIPPYGPIRKVRCFQKIYALALGTKPDGMQIFCRMCQRSLSELKLKYDGYEYSKRAMDKSIHNFRKIVQSFREAQHSGDINDSTIHNLLQSTNEYIPQNTSLSSSQNMILLSSIHIATSPEETNVPQSTSDEVQESIMKSVFIREFNRARTSPINDETVAEFIANILSAVRKKNSFANKTLKSKNIYSSSNRKCNCNQNINVPKMVNASTEYEKLTVAQSSEYETSKIDITERIANIHRLHGNGLRKTTNQNNNIDQLLPNNESILLNGQAADVIFGAVESPPITTLAIHNKDEDVAENQQSLSNSASSLNIISTQSSIEISKSASKDVISPSSKNNMECIPFSPSFVTSEQKKAIVSGMSSKEVRSMANLENRENPSHSKVMCTSPYVDNIIVRNSKPIKGVLKSSSVGLQSGAPRQQNQRNKNSWSPLESLSPNDISALTIRNRIFNSGKGRNVTLHELSQKKGNESPPCMKNPKEWRIKFDKVYALSTDKNGVKTIFHEEIKFTNDKKTNFEHQEVSDDLIDLPIEGTQLEVAAADNFNNVEAPTDDLPQRISEQEIRDANRVQSTPVEPPVENVPIVGNNLRNRKRKLGTTGKPPSKKSYLALKRPTVTSTTVRRHVDFYSAFCRTVGGNPLQKSSLPNTSKATRRTKKVRHKGNFSNKYPQKTSCNLEQEKPGTSNGVASSSKILHKTSGSNVANSSTSPINDLNSDTIVNNDFHNGNQSDLEFSAKLEKYFDD